MSERLRKRILKKKGFQTIEQEKLNEHEGENKGGEQSIRGDEGKTRKSCIVPSARSKKKSHANGEPRRLVPLRAAIYPGTFIQTAPTPTYRPIPSIRYLSCPDLSIALSRERFNKSLKQMFGAATC